ncbi:hypothetical protein [Paraburkholderia sp. J69-1]|uniref:hypothetical protein n=1 Tax=Paraburkholderia sp. J69-1 TaxID=2805436 RepID=UPI002AB7AB8F|nr:hypothetical protein [Paraburkholderia sp. J69-1]
MGVGGPALLCYTTVASDGSILVSRLFDRYPISDAFFSFSAINVRFSQVVVNRRVSVTPLQILSDPNKFLVHSKRPFPDAFR